MFGKREYDFTINGIKFRLSNIHGKFNLLKTYELAYYNVRERTWRVLVDVASVKKGVTCANMLIQCGLAAC